MSRLRQLVAGALLAVVAFTAHAQVYRCPQPDGSVQFQGTACPGGTIAPTVASEPAAPQVAASGVEDPYKTNPRERLPGMVLGRGGYHQGAADPYAGGRQGGQSGAGREVVLTVPDSRPSFNGVPIPPFPFLVGYVMAYIVFCGLIGAWANARHRSFFNWFALSAVFTPTLIFWVFLFRGRDPDY